MKKLIVFLIWFAIGATVSLALVWGGIYAVVREQEISDQIRQDRCARFGENTPNEYADYCKNLGV